MIYTYIYSKFIPDVKTSTCSLIKWPYSIFNVSNSCWCLDGSQGYLYHELRQLFESAQSYQNHVFSWFYAIQMILCSNFSFKYPLKAKSSKIMHRRVSVFKFLEFGYFDSNLAKVRILAWIGYMCHFLAWFRGQLLPKLISSNRMFRF